MQKLWFILLGLVLVMFISCSDQLIITDANNNEITSGLFGSDNNGGINDHGVGVIVVEVRCWRPPLYPLLYQSKVTIRNQAGTYKAGPSLTNSLGLVSFENVPIEELGEYFIAYADDGIIMPYWIPIKGSGNSGYHICYPNYTTGLQVFVIETTGPGGD
jgi:hypothetical protein